MKKLYTYNHTNVTTCSDFEIKFQDYLNYIAFRNPILFRLLKSDSNFKIQNLEVFRTEFDDFFESWLREIFNYESKFDLENISDFISTFKTTDAGFSELFANYNLYKKINSATDTFYFYDITIDEEEKYKGIINDKPDSADL